MPPAKPSHHESARGNSRLDRLSPQKRQVLKLVVEGRTSREIATLLHLSPRTVETYRGYIMAELEIGNIPDLVRFAIRNGITTL